VSKQLHKLSAREVATLTKPGRHSDGGGLYLSISPSRARSWVFMWKVAGKRREMGLGSLRDVPLAKARERAAEVRQKLANRLDPIAVRTASPR
jgi:Arm DNA-binding domain